MRRERKIKEREVGKIYKLCDRKREGMVKKMASKNALVVGRKE